MEDERQAPLLLLVGRLSFFKASCFWPFVVSRIHYGDVKQQNLGETTTLDFAGDLKQGWGVVSCHDGNRVTL